MIVGIFQPYNLFSQKDSKSNVLTPESISQLQDYEKSLKILSDSMMDGTRPTIRVNALKQFIPLLKKSLRVTGSFDYGFDSLKFMRVLKSPDGLFRIINWGIPFEDGTFKYFGVIHLNKKDSLHIIPLYDMSSKQDTSIDNLSLDANNWFGAYYNTISKCKVKGKVYYMLIGWNGHDLFSDKKVIEVLSFNKSGAPIFGAPIFDYKGEERHRMIFTYNGKASFLLNYIPDKKMFTFDHLSAADKKSEGKPWTYVPDGEYNYFVFKKGKWLFQDKELFDNLKRPLKEAGD
jgi:hypothetical protein